MRSLNKPAGDWLNGDVEHLHDPAENPLEVVVTHLLAVPSEPASARERVTVSVKSNVAAGPDPAPHVLGACRTRHTEVGCVHLSELVAQAPRVHHGKRVDELARVVAHDEESGATHVLPVELLEILAQLTEENILNLVREFALELLLDQLQI